MSKQNNTTDHDEPTPLVNGTKAKEEEKDFSQMLLQVYHPKRAVEWVVAKALGAKH